MCRRSFGRRLTASLAHDTLVLSRLALAAVCLLAAVFLPAAQIDTRRANRIAEFEQEASREAARLTPVDDGYVDRVTHPYPIRSSTVLRLILVADALALVFGRSLKRVVVAKPCATPAGPTRDAFAWWPQERWTVVGLTALGAGLRFTNGNRDLWLDEITSLTRRVQRPVTEILLQSISPNNHLLNSLLGRVSLSIFGESAWALRLPAVIFGIATIPVFYALVRRYSPAREAFLATLALVLSYHHVASSQDARGFTGFLFGGLLGTVALLQALDTNRARDWWLYAAAMVVSVVSVLLGPALIVAQIIAVTLLRPSRRFYVMVGTAAFASAHVYALIIPDIFGFVFDEYRRPETGWTFSSELWPVVLRGLALGPAGGIVLLAGGVIAAIGAIGYWRQDRLVASLLLLPQILMVAAFGMFGINFFPRFFLFALPVALMLAARGAIVMLDRLPGGAFRRLGFQSAVVALIALSVFMLRPWWWFPKQNYRGPRTFVDEQRREGDAVVTVGLAAYGYEYYWPEITRTNRISELDDIIARHRRVWLIYTFPGDIERRRPKLLRFITGEFRQERVFPGTVGDGDMRVCLRDRP